MRLLPASLLLLAACKSENTLSPEPDPVYPDLDPVIDFPDPPEPMFYLVDEPHPMAVSDYGQVLLWNGETGGDVYLWTESAGKEWVTTTGTWYNAAHDVSADGRTIIGSYGDYTAGEATQAATWTAEAGWTKLGALPTTLDCPAQSGGYALSADATLATGLAYDGCNAHGFLWDAEGGLVAMDSLGNGGNRVSAMSRGGELMAGFAQGDSARTPAVWYADGSGEVLNMAFTGEFYGVNDAGTQAVGQLGTKAAVWDVTLGHTLLGALGGPGESSGTALAFCGADDQLIIGRDSLAGGMAAAWTESTGWIAFHELMELAGVELPDNARLFDAVACTPDRTVFTGRGGIGEDSGTWVLVLPEGHLDPLFD